MAVAPYNKIWKECPELATSPSAMHRVRIIKSLLDDVGKNDHILDIGCGTCVLLDALNERGYRSLHGMDIAGDAFDLIQDTIKGKIDLLVGDITTKDSLPEKKFNAIVCSEILEHIPDDKQAVKNIKELLLKNGKLIISVPYDMKNWTKHDDAAGHFRRYDKKELEILLTDNGFTIEKSFVWGWPVYFLYWRLILSRIEPNSAWKSGRSAKKYLAKILFQLFKIDDLFKWSNKGMRLFIVARS